MFNGSRHTRDPISKNSGWGPIRICPPECLPYDSASALA